LPAVLARPYLSLKDPYTDFSREFEHQLKSRARVLQGRANATATIEVTKDLVEQRTLSVSARNIPTEYELTYTVTFAVRARQGTAEAADHQPVEGLQLRGKRAAREGTRGGHPAPANGARSGHHRDASAHEPEIGRQRCAA
jgi:hypothetical protein